MPPADRAALADLVVRIGLLAEDLPEVASLELYPVLVAPPGTTVVGARATRGWGLSWCREKWWGGVVAVIAGTSPAVKVSLVIAASLLLRVIMACWSWGKR